MACIQWDTVNSILNLSLETRGTPELQPHSQILSCSSGNEAISADRPLTRIVTAVETFPIDHEVDPRIDVVGNRNGPIDCCTASYPVVWSSAGRPSPVLKSGTDGSQVQRRVSNHYSQCHYFV